MSEKFDQMCLFPSDLFKLGVIFYLIFYFKITIKYFYLLRINKQICSLHPIIHGRGLNKISTILCTVWVFVTVEKTGFIQWHWNPITSFEIWMPTCWEGLRRTSRFHEKEKLNHFVKYNQILQSSCHLWCASRSGNTQNRISDVFWE